MSEKQMYASIRKITFLMMGAGILVCAIAFDQPTPYVLGILLGGLSGIMSFNMVIQMVDRLSAKNASQVAVSNYVLRFFGVAAIFFIAMSKGVNVFALFIGFLMSKIAIQVYAQLERRGMHG